jgi:hypothetical protein
MKTSDWISVKNKLPEVDENVMVYTTKGKMGISSMYISKDQYGNILGDKEWRGSNMMTNSITHWQKIVLPKE